MKDMDFVLNHFVSFRLCISLCKNATLLIRNIGTRQEYLSFPKVLPNDSVWLVIELFERALFGYHTFKFNSILLAIYSMSW